jgi:hypothetical protein
VAFSLKKYHLALMAIVFLLNSCTNSFEYKKSDWVEVAQSDLDNFSTAYVDQNRIECSKDQTCMAWVKILFAKQREIPFYAKKKGEVSGSMLTKKIQSSVKYFCGSQQAQIISYQIYNNQDQVIDKKWIQDEVAQLSENTLQFELYKYVCKNK